jgi:hypothetical protein
MTWRSRKYLDAVAALRICTVESPACRCNPSDDTVIPAHSDQGEDGKGKGIKADDSMVAAACHDCHTWLGCGAVPRDLRNWYMDRGIKRTIRAMVGKGVLRV